MTTTYPPAVQALLAKDRLPALGPGQPNLPMRNALASLTIEDICGANQLVDADSANACLAGLWLHHDFLDESHKISQDLDTPEGSYWHAIMHRREGDFSNSKYWLRRVGPHPLFQELAKQGASVGFVYTTPFDFVDTCERIVTRGTGDEAAAKRMQMLEWRLLFDWCFMRAFVTSIA